MSGDFIDHWKLWDNIRSSLQVSRLVNTGGKLNRSSLLHEFRSLGRNDVLILNVVEQNAAILIRQDER